jgi:hypothetical protein
MEVIKTFLVALILDNMIAGAHGADGACHG